MNENVKRQIGNIALVLLGNFINAFAVKLFLIPGNLITGGVTGIGLVMNRLWGFDLSLVVLILNTVCLLLGWATLGSKFAATTVLSSFAYPVFIKVLDYIVGDYYFTNDIMLCTLFCGILVGISIGLAFRAGASTGGMDIPPLILNKYFKLNVSVGLYGIDFIILLAQAFNNSAERILYGIVLLIIYTIVIDKMMVIGNSRTEIKIISDKAEEIREEILSEIDRGVTMIDGEGGYQRDKKQIVLSVISNRELAKFERLIHNIDPECFMIVSKVTEVRGRGFSLQKKYQ